MAGRGAIVALGGPLRRCRAVTFLGLRLNWSDYSPSEQEQILGAGLVAFPTVHYWRQLSAMGVEIYPSAASYSHLGDKAAQLSLFQMAGLPMPRTRIFTGRQRLERILDSFSMPFVAKLPKGSSRGQGVFLIRDQGQLEAYLARTSTAYIQEYLPIDRDIRIVVVRGEVVHAYWKEARPGHFHNNVAAGGQVVFDPVPEAAKELAEALVRRTSIDHAGLDVAWLQGRPLLLEANIHFGTEGFEAAGIDYPSLLCSKLAEAV